MQPPLLLLAPLVMLDEEGPPLEDAGPQGGHMTVPPQPFDCGPHAPPPQGFTGAQQTCGKQTLVMQSFPLAHPWPTAHFGHVDPQSMSVSLPSWTPSVQDATHLPATQE